METKFELNGNTDPHVVEEFLRENNWYSFNGILRAKNGKHFGVWSVDIRDLYSVHAQEVAMQDTEKNELNAVRVYMKFTGGRELRTRVFPTESDAWKEILVCLLWLRDYYMGLAEHEITYDNALLFKPEPIPTWDNEVGVVDYKTTKIEWTIKCKK